MSAKAGSLRVIQWCQGEDLRRALVPWQQRILLGSYQLAKIDRGVRDFEFKKFQRWIHQIYHVPFFSIFPILFHPYSSFFIHFPSIFPDRYGPGEADCRHRRRLLQPKHFAGCCRVVAGGAVSVMAMKMGNSMAQYTHVYPPNGNFSG